MRTDRIMPSAWVKQAHASPTRVAMKDHRICDSVRNGRYWWMSVWNRAEYRTPSAPTMMAVDSVSQNGPSIEPR